MLAFRSLCAYVQVVAGVAPQPQPSVAQGLGKEQVPCLSGPPSTFACFKTDFPTINLIMFAPPQKNDITFYLVSIETFLSFDNCTKGTSHPNKHFLPFPQAF